MIRSLIFVSATLLFQNVFAFDKIPQNFNVLVNPAGPAVAMKMATPDISKIEIDTCTNVVKYTGDTRLLLGNQTYKLASISSSSQQICRFDSDFKKFTNLIFRFVNIEFGNEIRVVLDSKDLDFVEVAIAQGHLVRGKVLN